MNIYIYLAILALGAAIGGYGAHKWDDVRYSRLQADYSKYQAQVAQANEASQKAAADALRAQAKDRDDAERHNQEVINELQQKTAAAESHRSADSAFIRKLLNTAPSCASAGSTPVPEPSDHSESAGASGTRGAQEMAVQLCVDTKAEDERNADRLDALIAEITLQMR